MVAAPNPQAVTRLLERINEGDRTAEEELLPLVYGELRALANQVFQGRGNQPTLQATALVHEAYLKLLGSGAATSDGRRAWSGRAHFFAVAARAMRNVLADSARRASRLKRGGGAERVTLSDIEHDEETGQDTVVDLLDLHEALEALESANPRIARVVELRFLGGLTVEELALEMGVSERSVFKDWRAGRALLRRMLDGGGRT